MKITITSTDVESKPWQKGERSGVIRTQEAMFETVNFRMRGRLDLGKDQPAHAIGEYEVNAEEILEVGDFGDLKVSRRFKMKPFNKLKAAS